MAGPDARTGGAADGRRLRSAGRDACDDDSVKAAVMKEPGVIAVEQFPLPEPEPGAVILEMSMSGICGTDKHTFRGETLQYAGTPHERQIEYPLICGHENVGRIAATGGEVLDSEGQPLRPGDRVVPAANVSCGRCWFCQNGPPYYMCERSRTTATA